MVLEVEMCFKSFMCSKLPPPFVSKEDAKNLMGAECWDLNKKFSISPTLSLDEAELPSFELSTQIRNLLIDCNSSK